MAALRNGVNNAFALKNSLLSPHCFLAAAQVRHKFIGQEINDPPVLPRQYEISRDPEEWKFVTRLLGKRIVPEVIPKPEYPSGWTPPKPELAITQPYFVKRTKNHMLAVYLKNEDRGQRKITFIKNVQGDIWLLHNELKEHVEEMHGKKIPSQILECNSVIKLKGDHYHWVEQFLLAKGF